MKLSHTGFVTNKITTLDALYPAQDMLLQTGQIVQYGSGIFAYNNVTLRLLENIKTIIKDVLDEFGCVEVILPTMQPQNIWVESGRLDGYIKSGTMLTIQTPKGNYSMAPTAEEAVTDFVRRRVHSYKSVPFTLYQIGEKFRNEIRPRGYLMRAKSFLMMDAYSFNADQKCLVETYENLKQAYLEIFRRLDMPVVPVAADGGDMGDGKSEEFVFMWNNGEDVILYDEKTGKGFNTELLQSPNHKEHLAKEYGITDTSTLVEKRGTELGHIFQLGTKYSKSMNALFADADGKQKPYEMGCYGIGVSRILATLYETNTVAGGISLPPHLAPYLVHIIATDTKAKEAEKLYKQLTASGIPCIYDDRAHVSIGVKIKDVKILGTPYMVILGDKVGAGECEFENTKTGSKKVIKQTDIKKEIKT